MPLIWSVIKIKLKLEGKYKSFKNNLLRDYFKDRSQSTVLNNVMSEHKIVNIVVPQGSCLGPLLFLVNIKDIFSSPEICVRLFSDEGCLSY